MLLFLPILFLLLALLGLGLGRLQRGFRSSWLVAFGGAALAWLSLLGLRLRIPLPVATPVWWAGRGLEFEAVFTLNETSWTLAFLTASLLLSALMYQVEHAVRARGSSWAPTLAAGLATLLACFAGDGLTLALSWVVLDAVLFGSLVLLADGPEARVQALQRLPLHLLASSLALAAWLLAFYGPGLQSLLLVLAGGLRLGLWHPRQPVQAPQGLRVEQQALLFYAPLAAGLAALGLAPGQAPWPFVLLIGLPSLYCAFQWLRGETPAWLQWQLACSGLAAAGGALGQPQAVMAYASLLFLGPAVLPAVQATPGRLRPALAVAGAALLCSLPLTASQGGLSMLASSPVAFVFLPVQAALAAGWGRFGLARSRASEPAEPWMVTIQRGGLTLAPIVLVGFGLGLLPGAQEAATAWWPSLVLVALAAGLALVRQQLTWRPSQAVRARYALLGQLANLSWLGGAAQWARRGLAASLGLLASLLEGPAGVLWALVVLTFLVSLMMNLGIGA